MCLFCNDIFIDLYRTHVILKRLIVFWKKREQLTNVLSKLDFPMNK